MRTARREMQMVFQDPYSSLNPRMRASTIVEEPLIIHGIGSKAERRDRVAELFRLVGLDPAHLDRYPHEFSGDRKSTRLNSSHSQISYAVFCLKKKKKKTKNTHIPHRQP